eukprot:CAMPEP_0183704778 /NCGR_PEP_ID=MMETSP0737-20130205/2052_1 /TAXON_ID=385413 /ORGANISM="Thalassiosira miniscula, Strain CCMP1093" /LENGTH=263 /DNA_ID=CAMNT_0025931779 /DNA_START=97 /DNA_END=885 /DNA_ORIENTATION=-
MSSNLSSSPDSKRMHGKCAGDKNSAFKRCRINEDVELLAERLGGNEENITYLTEDNLSWIIHIKQWMPTTSKEEFDKQWSLHPEDRHQLKLFGRMFTENRWSQSWGHSYSYSGSTNRARPIEESAMIQLLIDRANEVTRGLFASSENEKNPNRSSESEAKSELAQTKPYNGCLQNWYLIEDTIGLHADDERDLQAQYPIISLTWGGTRRFVLKPRDKSLKKVEMYLEDGDLLLMGGLCQKTHRHEVPKPRSTMDPETSDRINW